MKHLTSCFPSLSAMSSIVHTLATILIEQPKSDALADLEDYKDLLSYFCLTNYFKCSFTETKTEKDEKKATKRSGILQNGFINFAARTQRSVTPTVLT